MSTLLGGKLGNILLASGILIVVVLSAAILIPRQAMAEQPILNLISVNGEAQTQVKPDVATARFGVETNAPTAKAVQNDNATKMTAVIDALVAAGISKDDIQTDNYSVYPQYEWHDEKSVAKQVLVGFRCNNSVVVRISDISKVGDVIDAAADAGANSIGSISFGLKDSTAVREEMVAKAVKNARSKADIMAEAAGVHILGVHSISDGYYSVSGNMPNYSLMEEGVRGGSPIETGSLTISASVRMECKF